MQFRKLGNQGLEVSTIGLGCLGMSDFYGHRDDEESVATIHLALDSGVTMLDTADMYGAGDNERLIGSVLRDRRRNVIVATKFGMMPDDRGIWNRICGRPEHVRNACEASLTRLGIDTIDLYYQHRVDPDVPIEETVGAMADLVSAGKVRYLGLSEAAPDTIRRAHAIHPISAVQSEYSLWSRDPERALLPTLREFGIGFVPYSPLGRGFLTGRITGPDEFEPGDYRRSAPRFQGTAFTSNLELVKHVESVAAKKGCSAAQLALAWVLSRGHNIVPIPGTKRRTHLRDNLGALNVVMSGEDISRIDAAMPPGAAHGARAIDMSSLDQ